MANPALNEKTFAPERLRTLDAGVLNGEPVREAWRDRMTLDGVVLRSFTLLPILLLTGVVGWRSVDRADGTVALPGWLLLAVLAGLGVALLTVFRPHLSRVTAPGYAAIEGLVLGAISAVYDSAYDGIVLQAVMLTAGVFVLMLGLFAKRIVTVDDKFRRGVMLATGAVFVVYLLTLVMNLFGADVPYIHDSGAVGILFSLAVVEPERTADGGRPDIDRLSHHSVDLAVVVEVSPFQEHAAELGAMAADGACS